MTKVKLLLALLAGSLLLSGCDFDVYKLPLPGGTDTGSNPMTIHVMFADVLDLVPKSTVKVDDVSVGQVTDIALDHGVADVTLQMRGDTKLPANAVATIRQTSLLGEKFVSLAPPPTGSSQQPLADGDTIPLERTGRNPEVEEVLGALSLLLNGGGVAQLHTITHELNLALDGHESAARSVLDQINTLMTQLDQNKAAIVDAIDSLDKLSISVRKQEGSIDLALEQLPSALTSLDKQRHDLVRMLQSLNHLGDVGVRVIKASKDATIASVRQLDPVLTELSRAGDDLVKSFNVFLTYPFVDEVVGRDPQVARNLHMGDYTNLSIELDLSVPGADGGGPPTLPTNLPTVLDPTVILDNVTKCLRNGDPTSKACRKVLRNLKALTQLKKECAKQQNQDKDICKQVNAIPGLPGASGSGGLPLPSISLPGGLGRTGFGPTTHWSSTRGPTMGQLMKVYDPTLVSLLVPGMVTR